MMDSDTYIENLYRYIQVHINIQIYKKYTNICGAFPLYCITGRYSNKNVKCCTDITKTINREQYVGKLKKSETIWNYMTILKSIIIERLFISHHNMYMQ